MSEKSRLEYLYKELQSRGLPDLWCRIEEGVEAKELKPDHLEALASPADKNSQKTSLTKNKDYPRRRKFFWHYGAGFAAAAFCILLTARIGRLHDSQTQEAGVAELIAADGYAAETNGYSRYEMAGEEQAGIFNEQPEPVQAVVWYDELPVSGTVAASPPKEAVYAFADCLYFTEEVLKRSSVLCQASVGQISYEENADGDVWTVCYELTIHEILSGGGKLSEGQKLQVRSPLIGTVSSKGLYIMKEGGNYLLPLTRQKDGWELTFPYAPQIEQTRNGGYIFHTGWQSLLTEDTVVVMKGQQAPEDYYYDRMVFRRDPEFVSSLILLAENTQE